MCVRARALSLSHSSLGLATPSPPPRVSLCRYQDYIDGNKIDRHAVGTEERKGGREQTLKRKGWHYTKDKDAPAAGNDAEAGGKRKRGYQKFADESKKGSGKGKETGTLFDKAQIIKERKRKAGSASLHSARAAAAG